MFWFTLKYRALRSYTCLMLRLEILFPNFAPLSKHTSELLDRVCDMQEHGWERSQGM